MLPPRNLGKRGSDRRIRSAKHRAFVRTHLCIAFARLECEGKVECCHVKDVALEQCGSVKPGDLFTVSMCRRHHRESEKNEAAWGADMGIDVLAVALEFASKSPDKIVRDAVKAYLSAPTPA